MKWNLLARIRKINQKFPTSVQFISITIQVLIDRNIPKLFTFLRSSSEDNFDLEILKGGHLETALPIENVVGRGTGIWEILTGILNNFELSF